MLHRSDHGHDGDDPVQDAEPAECLATLFLSVPDAARRAGVSTRTIRRAIQEGRLPATRDGRGFLIAEDALEAFLSADPREAADQPGLAIVPFPSPDRAYVTLPAELTLFIGREQE